MVILLRSRHLPAVIDRKRSFGWGCPFPQRARRLRCGRQAMGVAWRLWQTVICGRWRIFAKPAIDLVGYPCCLLRSSNRRFFFATRKDS